MKVIGTVVGTKTRPNTPSEFHFWIPLEEETVSIGSIIKAEDGIREVYGVVEAMESYSEVDDVLLHQLSRGGDPEVQSPNREQSVIVCKARVLRQSSDRPLREGIVYYPSRSELEDLLTVEGCNIPFGVFTNTDGVTVPIKVDENYILGYEGAHVNISGMSGLGTKTSTFLFILSSIFTHSKEKVACILFNIKSDDLLYIDEDSPNLTEEDRAIYEACGITPKGFNARFFAPSKTLYQGDSLRKDIEIFRWGYREIEEFIPSLLKAGDQDQKDKLDTAFYDLKRMARERNITSFSELLDFMERELLRQDKGGSELIKGSYKATWGKLYNQIKGFNTKYGGLITSYDDEVVELPYNELEDKQVWVIDIQQLGFYARKLVFEKVITEFEKRLEAKELKVNKLILFMDELNKYAPSHQSAEVASLKAKLIDISARGRSIGLSLFGAEQFKSKVDQNIIGNVSTDIYGKTKESELIDPIYRKFSDEIKEKIRRFSKGEKLIDHELFDAPIFARMPRPPCMLGSDKIRMLNIAPIH
jgi:hypothetical protein